MHPQRKEIRKHRNFKNSHRIYDNPQSSYWSEEFTCILIFSLKW